VLSLPHALLTVSLLRPAAHYTLPFATIKPSLRFRIRSWSLPQRRQLDDIALIELQNSCENWLMLGWNEVWLS
jgi:hypothetical protein